MSIIAQAIFRSNKDCRHVHMTLRHYDKVHRPKNNDCSYFLQILYSPIGKRPAYAYYASIRYPGKARKKFLERVSMEISARQKKKRGK